MNLDKRPLFHRGWWLEAIAPGDWGCVEKLENGQIVASLPYIRRKNFAGGYMLSSGPLTKYLGPWVMEKEDKFPTRYSRESQLFTELWDDLPRYSWFSQNCHYRESVWLPAYSKGLEITPKITYVINPLTVGDDYHSFLWAGLHKRHRQEIKKAEKAVTVQKCASISDVYNMVELTYRRQNRRPGYTLEFLENLEKTTAAHKCSCSFVARGLEGEVHSGIWCVWDDTAMYYLVGGADPARRSNGSMTYLLFHAMMLAQEKGLEFDFEGSMVPSIEYYFRGFGGQQKVFMNISGGKSYYKCLRQLKRLFK